MPNRFAAQPMEINSADGGGVSGRISRRYENLARGRWGIVIMEAVSVTRDSLARRNGLVVDAGSIKGFSRLIESFKRIDGQALFLVQLTHSGRMSGEFSKKTGVYGDDGVPLLDAVGIERLQESFCEAARLMIKAGADGVDIKSCHGYLGAEFLRPANRRSDGYGESAENRARFLGGVIATLKRELPDCVVGTRISVYEGIRGGCGTPGPEEVIEDLGDIMEVLRHVVDAGADYLNISAGIPAVTPHLTRPVAGNTWGMYHHFRYAREVRRRFPGTAVIGSAYSAGRQEAAELAAENIARGYADFAGFGRQNLADPLFPLKFRESVHPINYCTLCGGCSRLLKEQREVYCTQYEEKK